MIEDFHIEIVKYKIGLHHISLLADDTFFSHYENPLVSSGQVKVDIELEKHTNWMNVQFTAQGILRTTCDRCLVAIDMPISTNYRIVYKTAIDETQEDEDEVKYLKQNQTKIDLSGTVYETILLALPMVKNCDELEKKPCDESILRKLTEDEISKTETDPRWDKLKEIK